MNNRHNGWNVAGAAGRIGWRWLLAWGMAAGMVAGDAPAGAGGESVVVLYNQGFGPDSRAVAEHYAEVRGVPKQQVIGFSLPRTESITRTVFRESLQRPLVKALESRRLVRFPEPGAPTTPILSESKIRYLVLAYGMPLKIAEDAKLGETVPAALEAPLRRNGAAVDTELACLPLIERGVALTGPIRNPLFATTNVAALHPTNGIFLVTRLDGPTYNVALRLVDQARHAETNGFWGRAWFDERGLGTNSPHAKGDIWIHDAWRNLRRQGFESVLDVSPATFPVWQPMPQIAIYAGWYDGNVSGPFLKEPVEFVPGAVAYHLHSFSARSIRTAGAGWVGPLLARGVTATMGTVEEPYLDLTPHVGVFFTWLFALGHNFAEAAYASQPVLSWQTTVVGDPLYRPMARAPQPLHEELERTSSPYLPWSHLRIVNLNLATGATPEAMVSYLGQIPLTSRSAVLSEKLGDLLVEAKQEAKAVEAWRAALELQPSPQQALQLRFKLMELLARLGREAEALALYDAFFQSHPKYPGQIRFYEAALPLARKVGEGRLADLYEREIRRLTPPPPATNNPAAKP